MQVSIRVRGKTDPSSCRKVTVDRLSGAVKCDCGGFNGEICSHIDAVLIAGERAMVWPGDEALADEAARLMDGRLSIPDYWKATWRRNYHWRGISPEARRKRTYVRQSDKPLVCFTGNCGRPRSELMAEAKEKGWDVVNNASAHLDVLVAADPTANSAKLKKARACAIAIVSPEDWVLLQDNGELR